MLALRALVGGPRPASGYRHAARPVSSLISKHFRATNTPHPLTAKPAAATLAPLEDERLLADKQGRQQNHIWSRQELDEALATAHDVHTPITLADKFMHSFMYYGLYHPFNIITGYKQDDPSPRSIEWRLIVLESFAGVPGFVAAGMRHFRSLRSLQRDHGWIHTLLEEAENERMHLLTCLTMFEAGPLTRLMCVGAQFMMTPFLLATYMVHPKAMHRFVGYLEQTACHTYHNIIEHIETPGTQLHDAWAELPAPEMAKGYWKLEDDAKWVDALKCIYADESHHRDVNHTFADLDQSDDPNPFVAMHKEDAVRAWKINEARAKVAEGRAVLEEHHRGRGGAVPH